MSSSYKWWIITCDYCDKNACMYYSDKELLLKLYCLECGEMMEEENIRYGHVNEKATTK